MLGAALALSACYHPPPAPVLAPIQIPVGPPPAADATPGPGAVSCDALVSAFLARDPTLRAARAGLPVARAAADAAGPFPSPEVRFHDDLRDIGQQPAVDLRLRLPKPGVADGKQRAAEARVVLSEAQVRVLEIEVARKARRAHADLVLAAGRARLSQEAASAAAAEADLVAQRERAGVATAVSLSRVRLNAETRRLQAEADTSELDVLRTALESQSGVRPDDTQLCQPPAPLKTVDPAEHPAVQAAQARARSADAESFAAERAGWIWPAFFQIGWQRDAEGKTRRDPIIAEFGVVIPLPGADASDVARAKASKTADAVGFEAERVRADVLRTAAAWQAATAHADALGRTSPELDAARALLTRGEAVGAAPAELAELRSALRDRAWALAQAQHAVAWAAADYQAAVGVAGVR